MNVNQAVRSALGGVIMRGKVEASAIADGRTMLQVSLLDGDVRDGVELLLPHGTSALPPAGADVLVFSVLGTRDHNVAIGADSIPTRIAGLQPGGVGISDGVRVLVINHGRIEALTLGETLRQLVTDQLVPLFNAHVHSGVMGGPSDTGPPTTPMTSAQLTGAFHAGGQS